MPGFIDSSMLLVLLVSAGAVAVIAVIQGKANFLSWFSKHEERHRKQAEEALASFCSEVQSIRHAFNSLSAYANEYYNTFQQAGWDEIGLLLEDLQIAESSLHLLMERKRYDDVCGLSRFLLGTLPAFESRELMSRYEGLEHLAGWRGRGRELLIGIINASMESARKTASVGISRKRATKPTLVTLAELRSALTE